MGWLKGKKTYLAAIVLVVLGVGSFLSGFGDAVTSFGLIAIGAGFAGLGAKAQRHRAEILDVLQALKEAINHQPLTATEKARLATDAIAVGTDAMTSAAEAKS